MVSIPQSIRSTYLRAQFGARRVLGVSLIEKLRFLLAHRKWPNIDEARTFSEMIMARKLGVDDPRFAICADKVAAREWVAERIGPQYLIPAMAVYDYDRLDDLVIEPDQVIKCANRAGGVYFTSDKACQDRAWLIARLREKLDFDFASWTGERWYGRIPRRVIVEKQLADAQGRVPQDYKLLVFHGVVRLVQVHVNRFTRHRVANLDRDWQPIPVSIGVDRPEQLPPRPTCLSQMLEIAETLGKEFDFVRVDLYQVDEQVYFGEMTFAPASGLITFRPRHYDRAFGAFWAMGRPSSQPGATITVSPET